MKRNMHADADLGPPPDCSASHGGAAATAAAAAPLRILFAIAEQYPTHRADVNALFGKYLRQQGIHTDLLTVHAPDGPLPGWPAGKLLTVRGKSGRLGKHLGTMRHDLRLLRLARRGYDALQVRDKAFGALVGLIAARAAGIPFYYWMSFPTAEAWTVFARDRGLSVGVLRWLLARLRGALMHVLLYRVVLPRADHVFVQSERMRDNLVRKGIAGRRMTPVPMGFDGAGAAGRMAGPKAPPFERPTFVYLGTLDRVRAPEVMIEAVDIVRRQAPNVKLLLVGDADEESDRVWLRSLIRERGLAGHVELTGWLPMAEGWALAARCLAGLSPVPRGELFDVGSPTKAVEYFGLGLPVIANDQPDQALVLAGAGGSCVALSAHAFAERMLEVIACEDKYRQQGQAGRRWVRAMRNYEVLAATVAAVYRTPAPP